MRSDSRPRPQRASIALRAWLLSSTLTLLFFACYSEPKESLSSSHGGASGSGAVSGNGVESGNGGAEKPQVPAECGDGLLADAEGCDDGNQRDGDGCSASCVVEPVSEGACGDGVHSDQEQCDDGNLQSGDGCDASCLVEECGNERVDMGEECDPPRAGQCTANCALERPNCGDGAVQGDENEECDDGNEHSGDGCFECRVECGDGRIDESAGEECDPAQSSACGMDCLWRPTCGDGVVQTELGEECDPSRGSCVQCKRVELPPPSPPSCDGAGGAGGADGEAAPCEIPACVPGPAAESIQNGEFTNSTTGWAAHASSVQIKTATAGESNPPALEVMLGPTTVRSTSGAVQCIPVLPGARYQFRAEYWIPQDAPDGVAANVTAFLYPGTRCTGEFVRPALSGPAGNQRNAWTSYQFNIDTAPLLGGGAGSEGRLLLRLGVVAPAQAESSRVLWDGVTLLGRCGNCEVEGVEACDDGNTENGDGCNSTCQFEICGDGAQADGEQCDDGNAVFGADGDTCTPSCKVPSACDTCSSPHCATEMLSCLGLEGTAQAGPYKGIRRSTLCDRLRSCVKETACNLANRYVGQGTAALPYLENCYCGTSGPNCFKGRANGSCRAEVEAALETTDPVEIAQRFRGSDTRYPATAAIEALLACERRSGEQCRTTCEPTPRCGDGHIQDRNLVFTFTVDGQDVACRDDFTHTGRGCSFEECDDGNTQPGDGCDEHCFVEACGNRVIQSGEDCDDGNTASEDGCSAECKAEYHCGNSTVEERFEECDPPDPNGGKLCSRQEYQANPSDCGCDSTCHYSVCGNGVLQRPAEQCEPPGTTVCTDTCQFAEQTPCEQCLLSDPELATPYLELCSTDEECLDVLKCISQKGCFTPYPADCFCGEGKAPGHGDDSCLAPAFVPEGVCSEEILTGSLEPGEAETLENVNKEVAESLYDLERPTGVAYLLVTYATNVTGEGPPHRCYDACSGEGR